MALLEKTYHFCPRGLNSGFKWQKWSSGAKNQNNKKSWTKIKLPQKCHAEFQDIKFPKALNDIGGSDDEDDEDNEEDEDEDNSSKTKKKTEL